MASPHLEHGQRRAAGCGDRGAGVLTAWLKPGRRTSTIWTSLTGGDQLQVRGVGSAEGYRVYGVQRKDGTFIGAPVVAQGRFMPDYVTPLDPERARGRGGGSLHYGRRPSKSSSIPRRARSRCLRSSRRSMSAKRSTRRWCARRWRAARCRNEHRPAGGHHPRSWKRRATRTSRTTGSRRGMRR